MITNVCCGDVITKVKNGKVIINILNISESLKGTKNNELNKILHDDELVYKTTNVNLINKDYECVNKIKSLIQHNHMHLKERKWFFKTCDNNFEIFYLERVKIVKKILKEKK